MVARSRTASRWIERIEKSEYLEGLAQELARKVDSPEFDFIFQDNSKTS